MLGNQLDRGTIGDRVGLSQIFHGFDQQALPIHIPRIGSAFSFGTATQLGGNRNSENLSHEETRKGNLGQYIAQRTFFSTHSWALDSITYPRGETNFVFPEVFSRNTSPPILAFILIAEYLATR